MGVLETVARIIDLAGSPSRAALVREMRARFEARTGAFAPENAWFEERSRAFWCDALTRERFGRKVQGELTSEECFWLAPLERAHRGLFRAGPAPTTRDRRPGRTLVDVWSGAEVILTAVDDESRAELEVASGQLFDARVIGCDDPMVIALLPGAVFHSPDATASIEPVLASARSQGLSTHETLDALLRMQRMLRTLSRVRAAYAYRPEALSSAAPAVPVRRAAKGPT